MSNILERSRPAVSVLDFSAMEIETFLKQKLRQHTIEAAYIFGSLASNTASDWSDIDLIIVMQTSESFLERGRQFEELYELGLPIDILVYTPGEFEKLKKSNTGFWNSFLESHLRII